MVVFYGILANTAEPCSVLAPGTIHSVLDAPQVFRTPDISSRRAVAVAWDERLRRPWSLTSGTFSLQGTKDCPDDVLIFTAVCE